MNVFDFDKTIFPVDSSTEFFLYCLRKYPRYVMKNLAAYSQKGIKYAVGKGEAAELKEQLFSFLRFLPDPQKDVQTFWDKNFNRINSWYMQMKQDDDVIISASPEFLLRPVAEKLGVHLIATPMNIASGLIEGANCHDYEKVIRFRQEYPEAKIDAFYSDSFSDVPLARLASRAYLVKPKEIISWPADKL